MKNKIIVICLAIGVASISFSVKADFSGSTFTMNNPYSLCVTSTSITISNIVPAPDITATLIVSNASASAISVNWAAPGRALGLGSTNQLLVPGGQIAAISVNAVFPALVTYSTQPEQIMPGLNAPNSLTPELLYYRMTEGALSYQSPAGYFESEPVYLADSSTHGGSTGTITADNIPIQWVPNQNGTPTNAVHFNGSSTVLTAANPALFSFTTNLFTINIWVRNLTYPCALAGNGIYQNSGWYLVVNKVGEILLAAENPGSDTYVATTSTVAFAGQWAMITAVRTGPGTVLIYRDAILQNTVGAYTNPSPTSNPVVFGDNYYGNQYDGDLGTIRIYNRPLSTNEINALYVNDTTP